MVAHSNMAAHSDSFARLLLAVATLCVLHVSAGIAPRNTTTTPSATLSERPTTSFPRTESASAALTTTLHRFTQTASVSDATATPSQIIKQTRSESLRLSASLSGSMAPAPTQTSTLSTTFSHSQLIQSSVSLSVPRTATQSITISNETVFTVPSTLSSTISSTLTLRLTLSSPLSMTRSLILTASATNLTSFTKPATETVSGTISITRETITDSRVHTVTQSMLPSDSITNYTSFTPPVTQTTTTSISFSGEATASTTVTVTPPPTPTRTASESSSIVQTATQTPSLLLTLSASLTHSDSHATPSLPLTQSISLSFPTLTQSPSHTTSMSSSVTASHSATITHSYTPSVSKSSSQSKPTLSLTKSLTCPVPAVRLTVTGQPSGTDTINGISFADIPTANLTLSIVQHPNLTSAEPSKFSHSVKNPGVVEVLGASVMNVYRHDSSRLSILIEPPSVVDIFHDLYVSFRFRADAFTKRCADGTVATATLTVTKEGIGMSASVKSTFDMLSSAAGGASVMSLAPTSALQLARANVMMALSTCAYSHTQPFERSFNPTGIALGSRLGQYYRGAILGNFILLIACVIVHIAVAAVFYWWDEWYHKQGIILTIRYTYFPGLQIVPFCLLLPGTVAASIALYIHGGAPSDKAAAIVTLVIIAVVTGSFCIMVTKYFFSAKYTYQEKGEDGEELSQTAIYFLGKYRWAEIGNYWFSWCFLFHVYRLGCRWFIIVELVVSFAMGVLAGIRPPPGQCLPEAIALLACNFVMLLLAFYMRPHNSLFDQHHFAITSTIIFISSFLILLSRALDSLVMEVMAQVLIVVAQILSVARGAVYLGLLFRDVRLQELVLGRGGGKNNVDIDSAESSKHAYFFYNLKDYSVNPADEPAAPLPVRGRGRKGRWRWRAARDEDEDEAQQLQDTEMPLITTTSHTGLYDEDDGGEQSQRVEPPQQQRSRKDLRSSSPSSKGRGEQARSSSPPAQPPPKIVDLSSPSRTIRKRRYTSASHHAMITMADGSSIHPEEAREILEGAIGCALLTAALEFATTLFSSRTQSLGEEEIVEELRTLLGAQYAVHAAAVAAIASWEMITL